MKLAESKTSQADGQAATKEADSNRRADEATAAVNEANQAKQVVDQLVAQPSPQLWRRLTLNAMR